VLLPYVPEGSQLPEVALERAAARQPGADPHEVIAVSHQRVGQLIDEYVKVGASKFVLFPLVEPADWQAELTHLAPVLARQT